MAVIELEESDEETTVVKDQTKQSPLPSSSSGPADSDKGKSESVPAGANGDDSDGFETASEREVSDEDQDGGEGNNFGDADRKPEQQPLPVNPVVEQPSEEKQPEKSEESPEGALNDDESKQKALSQANDAKTEGNKLFGEGQFENALSKYELALQLAPDMPGSVELQSICHSNRAICFLKLGKCDDAIKECTKALELNPSYIKALLRRGEAHEKLEHYEEAIADLKKALELDPSDHQARRSIRRLEPLAAEKREKMKEEMMGKLKDMGNSILGRFGMSVDNFKAVKDPNTGSYSISFQR